MDDVEAGGESDLGQRENVSGIVGSCDVEPFGREGKVDLRAVVERPGSEGKPVCGLLRKRFEQAIARFAPSEHSSFYFKNFALWVSTTSDPRIDEATSTMTSRSTTATQSSL